MCSQLRPPSSCSSFTSKDLTRADDVFSHVTAAGRLASRTGIEPVSPP